MPHLSPLNWLFAPFYFWSLMISLTSVMWWSQALLFTPMLNYKPLFLPLTW